MLKAAAVIRAAKNSFDIAVLTPCFDSVLSEVTGVQAFGWIEPKTAFSWDNTGKETTSRESTRAIITVFTINVKKNFRDTN
jgi:hypothetical protein